MKINKRLLTIFVIGVAVSFYGGYMLNSKFVQNKLSLGLGEVSADRCSDLGDSIYKQCRKEGGSRKSCAGLADIGENNCRGPDGVGELEVF